MAERVYSAKRLSGYVIVFQLKEFVTSLRRSNVLSLSKDMPTEDYGNHFVYFVSVQVESILKCVQKCFNIGIKYICVNKS